jgi:hypothetical protein
MRGTCAAFSGGCWVLSTSSSFGQVWVRLWGPQILRVNLVIMIRYSMLQSRIKILLKAFRNEFLVTEGDSRTCLDGKFSGAISG